MFTIADSNHCGPLSLRKAATQSPNVSTDTMRSLYRGTGTCIDDVTVKAIVAIKPASTCRLFCLYLLLLLSSFVLLTQASVTHTNASSNDLISAQWQRAIPVVYVIHGPMPDYFLINIELASRYNPVVVLYDYQQDSNSKGNSGGDFYNSFHYPNHVSFHAIDPYMTNATKFGQHYKHMCKDHNPKRISHELRCFQRWFILEEFMRKHAIPRAFFGDGDSSVFANITEIASYRPHCDSVINIETQLHDFHWVGAGEASIWTLAGIHDFNVFALALYERYEETLRRKQAKGSSVVDMSALWLWWVARKNSPVPTKASFMTGRPFNAYTKDASAAALSNIRDVADHAYEFARNLTLPALPQAISIQVCNGMDVVNRTVFDHYHGWMNGEGFSFGFDEPSSASHQLQGVPYLVDASLRWGGKPESMTPAAVSRLRQSRLYLINLHYQGGEKRNLVFDVCRVLQRTGKRAIVSTVAKKICTMEMTKNVGVKCKPHIDVEDGKSMCL